jgi:outer membrane murein-binding lipoprotein Lpp
VTDTFNRTEADMAEAWQTLEEAALTLGISSRTLHRRLARNEFQTRMANGRREVLVVIDEPDPSLQRLAAAAGRVAVSAGTADAADTSATPATHEPAYTADEYQTTIETAADEVQQTMLALHEDRIRRTDLAIMAYQQSVTVAAAEARRAVTRSRVAWGVAGLAIIATFLGVTWGTHRVTKVSAEVSHLSASVRQLSDTVEVKSREVQELRHDSQAAKVAAARAEGELAAAKRQVDQLIGDRDRQAAEARLTAHSTPADVTASAAATQPIASATAATQPAVSAITPSVPPIISGATAQPAALVAPATRPAPATHPAKP